MRLLRRFVLVPVFLCLVFTVLLVLPLMAQTEVISGGGAATSVSAAAFPLLAPNGSAGAPSYSFSAAPTQGLFRDASTGNLTSSGSFNATSQIRLRRDDVVAWSDNAGAWSTLDTNISRAAPGVIKITGAASADGWIQNPAGDQFLTADHTNATATPTNLTDLTTTVTSGRKYAFELYLMQSQSVAADGVRIDFEGGTATATNFRATCTILDGTAFDTTTNVTALATDVTSTDVGTTVVTECKGGFEPSGNGTFIPRVGLEAASTGTITTQRGSWMLTKDMP